MNKQNIEGNYNVTLQDVNNSSVSIIIGKSADYKKLLDELKDLQDNLTDVASDKVDRLNQLKKKILLKEEEIELFKKDVIRLANIFNSIEINTDRLMKAKEYFDNGMFKEAYAILKLSDIDKDQNSLLLAKEGKEEELKDITKQLINNSNEYFIKAQSVFLVNYTSNNYGEVFNLFKRSIKSYSGLKNNYAMAYFLMRNQKYHIAQPYLLEALKHTEGVNIRILGNLLNDTGLCFKEQGIYEEAEKYYLDCLANREKDIDNRDVQFMYTLALDYMNLGTLYCDWSKFDKDSPLFEKALHIFRDYHDESSKYSDDLASCLNNLGKHYLASKDYNVDKVINYLKEAVQLRRYILVNESIMYSNRLATVLGNLGIAYMHKEEFVCAEDCFLEAIKRFEVYELINIFSYRASFIHVLVNTATFYAKKYPKKEAALRWANRAVEILNKSNMVEIIKMKATISLTEVFSHFGEKLPN